LIVLATVLLVIGLFASAHASESLYVSPGQDVTRNLDLTSGDRVTGTLTVTGLGTPIDFTVTNPSGNTILQYGSTLGTTFSFTAATTGTYTMHFGNSLASPAQCMIDYSTSATGTTEPSGFSGNTPYVIVTVIAVGAAVIFAFIAFRARKKPPPPPTNP